MSEIQLDRAAPRLAPVSASTPLPPAGNVRFGCAQCWDTGVVLARQTNPPKVVRQITLHSLFGKEETIDEETVIQAPFAFACSCPRAEAKKRAFPAWSSVAGSSSWELVP